MTTIMSYLSIFVIETCRNCRERIKQCPESLSKNNQSSPFHIKMSTLVTVSV